MLRLGVLLAGAMLLATAACTPDASRADESTVAGTSSFDNESPTSLPAATVDTTRSTNKSALTIDNSLKMNGLYGNGLYVNGLSFNSLSSNGLYVNGLPLNGLPLNGLYVNGLYVNGIGPNGLPVNGLPLNGLYVNGLPVNGLPVNGLPLNGLYVNGLPLNGLYVNGLPVNGLGLNGLYVNGLYVNGLPVNGLPVNGLYVNGLYVNGLPLNGLPVNGLYVNGANPAKAIRVADASGQLQNLSADQEKAFESMMAHLMWCALPSGNSVTVYDSRGQAHIYPGRHGLAPTWKTSALVDNPNGIDDSEELRWCMEHYRAVDSNNALYPGLALNEQQTANLQKLMKYTVECALNAGDSVNITFPSGPITFSGALGLAPTWKTGAINVVGQKAVSACLAARTNAHGTTVRISLRNPAYAGLATTALEKAQFKSHEGAFWGNVFGANPSIHACKAEGGGPAGRLCTDGSCGFTPDPIPSCYTASEGGCDSVDAEGNFTSCGPDDETVVLNTYLMTVKEISSGLDHSCARRHDGSVWCWGKNDREQTGQTASTYELDARQVMGLPSPSDEMNRPVNIITGTNASCAQTRGGQLWCWGDNSYGQLGNGSASSMRNTPELVSSLEDKVASVAAGGDHMCAVKMDGSVWCWGKNDHGQLGNGTLVSASTPVYATDSAVQVALGPDFSCALKLDGTVWCWGRDDAGQLADGGGQDSLSPKKTITIPGLVAITAGGKHGCTITSAGKAYCWGDNRSALGHPTSSYEIFPSDFSGVRPVVQISSGTEHTCALNDQGQVYCWGRNDNCQLARTCVGAGALGGTYLGLLVMDQVVAIHANGMSSFAQRADGTVWGWGQDVFGQLGTGEVTYGRPTPVQMTAFIQDNDGYCDFSESAMGADCALCGDGICAVSESCGSCAVDCASPTWYEDSDGDGAGSPSVSSVVCEAPTGWVSNASDCDDTQASVFSGASEVVDGLDNDCDGYFDEDLNLISDPSFAVGLSDWHQSEGIFTRTTSGCRTAGGCAILRGTYTSRTVETDTLAHGPGVVKARAFIKSGLPSSATAKAYVNIFRRNSYGQQYTTTSLVVYVGSGYTEITRELATTTGWSYGMAIVTDANNTLVVDDVEFVLAPN
ncbi:MAG: hypothetical protein IPK13_10045 [Deltaproteobacteria bacterium]|nr:hypothetical protein [Deltaproteobacteria bacterium]